MIHEMHIRFIHCFRKILKNRSLYHVRLFDIKRRLVEPDDVILLRCEQIWDDEGDRLQTVPIIVKSIHIYSDLRELFENITPRECGFPMTTSVKEAVSLTEDYYRCGDDRLNNLRAVAFKIHVIEKFNQNTIDFFEQQLSEGRRKGNLRNSIIDFR